LTNDVQRVAGPKKMPMGLPPPISSGGAVCLETGATLCRLGLPIEDCETLRNRVIWLVWVRWLVVLGALTAIGAGASLYPTMASWLWLAVDILALALANTLWQWWIAGGRRTLCGGVLPLSSYQIFTDFVLLAVAVHLTGGITGPLTPLFVLHGVFSAVLLPRWHTATTLASAAALLVGSVLLQHAVGWLPPWRIGEAGVTPAWMRAAVDTGFLAVATAGASVMGLDLSNQLRMRHSRILALARELESRNRKLHEVDEERLKLLSVASHDLRSPLAAVESRVDLFLNGYVGGIDDAQRGHLTKIKERVKGLRTFIDDLLDLTAIESAAATMKPPVPIDVGEQIRAAVADLAPVAEAAGCEIESSLPEEKVTVVAGPSRLARVWTNLLSNAIKYGGGKPVTVTVEPRDGRVVVSVRDRGMGIAPEDRAEIFKEYFRGKAARQAGIPGTGLGLAISRRVVESFGGTIEVESAAGEGATFSVSLPTAEGEPEGTRSREPRPSVVAEPGGPDGEMLD
jgi:signal transduction histidine kinase